MKPRLWTLLAAVIVLLAGMLLFGPLLRQGYFLLSSRAVLAGGLMPNMEQYLAFQATLPGFLFAAATTACWTGTVALVAGTLSPLPLTGRLGLGRSRLGRLAWLIVPLGALGLNQAIDAVYELSGFGRGAALESMLGTLAGARGAMLATAVLIVGALSATCEELFFRGYLQRRLVARLGPAAGIVTASFLFGLAHWDVHHSLFAFLFGLFVGLASWAADSLWPAVFAHVVNNTVAVLALVLGLDFAQPWIALGTGALACMLATAWILRHKPRRARAPLPDPSFA